MPRTPGRTLLAREQFHALTRPLIGMPISRAVRGAGSAILLELGTLATRTRTSSDRGREIYSKGQVSLMLAWSWRVERPGSIEFGSWSTNVRINRGIESLQGHTIIGVELEGRLPELVLALDGKRWLHTFMTAEGQPEWSIRMPDNAWVGVIRGHVYRQASRSETAALAAVAATKP